MSGPTWSLWAIPVVVFAALAAFIASVFIGKRSRQRGDSSITPRGRWLAGGVFRGDPRAGSSREEIPPPEELRSGQQSAPDGELPRTPAQRRAPENTDESGAPLPGPPRGPQAARR